MNCELGRGRTAFWLSGYLPCPMRSWPLQPASALQEHLQRQGKEWPPDETMSPLSNRALSHEPYHTQMVLTPVFELGLLTGKPRAGAAGRAWCDPDECIPRLKVGSKRLDGLRSRARPAGWVKLVGSALLWETSRDLPSKTHPMKGSGEWQRAARRCAEAGSCALLTAPVQLCLK